MNDFVDYHNGQNLGLEPPAAPQGEPSDIAAKLKDPNIVHVNMLRGTIAPITFDALAHVLGDDAKREWLAAQASSLQQDVEALLLMLENGEYAEHWAKTENGKRLEAAMTALHGKLSAAQAPAASAEPSDEAIRSEQVRRMAEDAARYRWLRDPCSGAERVIFYCRGDYGRGLMSGAMLDAAIDAAMREGGKQ